MTPLEKMARAYVDDGDHYVSDAPRITWSILKHDQKRDVCKGIQRALLALAEAELDEPMINAGWEHDNGTVNFEDDFRILLRVIANEGKDNDT